jgi:hypothetical protein
MKKFVIGLGAVMALAASGALAHSVNTAPASLPQTATGVQAASQLSTGLAGQQPVRLDAWQSARAPVGMRSISTQQCIADCQAFAQEWTAQCLEDFNKPFSPDRDLCILMGQQLYDGCVAGC